MSGNEKVYFRSDSDEDFAAPVDDSDEDSDYSWLFAPVEDTDHLSINAQVIITSVTNKLVGKTVTQKPIHMP